MTMVGQTFFQSFNMVEAEIINVDIKKAAIWTTELETHILGFWYASSSSGQLHAVGWLLILPQITNEQAELSYPGLSLFSEVQGQGTTFFVAQITETPGNVNENSSNIHQR